MSKHTPGPWWMGEQFHIVYAGNDHAAQCICPEVGGSNVPEAEANAHLIAAAPDLLGALEGLYALVQSDYPALLVDYDRNEFVLAAIRKAKGEGHE